MYTIEYQQHSTSERNHIMAIFYVSDEDLATFRAAQDSLAAAQERYNDTYSGENEDALEDERESFDVAVDEFLKFFNKGQETVPWVVVEGGLVQYQSGDWKGAPVDVVDLDFLKDGGSLEDAQEALPILRDVIDPMMRAASKDGTGAHDLQLVEQFISRSSEVE